MIKELLTIAETLLQNDETTLALKVLECVPARMRENPPPEILKMRNEILAACITAHGYMSSNFDCNIDPVNSKQILRGMLRGRLIQAELNRYTKAHICEVGPGEYWLPLGLEGSFTYQAIAMDQRTGAQFTMPQTTWDKKLPFIFVANEIIEHISNPHELAWECYKATGGAQPDVVHISTPHYCYDDSPKDWRKRGLPHLRAYTPKEFYDECIKMWPTFNWKLYTDGKIMSLRGVNPSCGIVSDLEPDKI